MSLYFTSGNSVAESKLTSHGGEQDGRADFIALKEHFEIITFPMAKMAIIIQDEERCSFRIRSRYHPNIDHA